MKKELNSLDLSILKWKKIVNEDGVDKGSTNCALCQEFIEDNLWVCEGCPVKEKTGRLGCQDTPWEEWHNHHVMNHGFDPKSQMELRVECPECKKLALKELKFLESLKEEKVKEFDYQDKCNMLWDMVTSMMEYNGDEKYEIPEGEEDKNKIKWMKAHRSEAQWVYRSIEELVGGAIGELEEE